MALRVLLVTSWNTKCGIAAYAQSLKTAVEAADPQIEVIPDAAVLDPTVLFDRYCVIRAPHDCELQHVDLIHLNHHDALHSRWTPEHIESLTRLGYPMVVTYHDTRSGEPGAENSEKLKAFAQVASSVIVHEPVADLRAIYWRQGIPPAAPQPAFYECRPGYAGGMDGEGIYPTPWKQFSQQPVLGTVGFDFPWKNYDRLARITAEEGWALVLLSNDATPEREAYWKALNPYTWVVRRFLPEHVVINYLAGCDATAFIYECSNNGTSGAIRQGIAARKPVIAHEGCRQFRDLYQDPTLGFEAIQWVKSWEELRETLRRIPPTRLDPMVHALAERDSWAKLGQQHARLYHLLLGHPLGQTVVEAGL